MEAEIKKRTLSRGDWLPTFHETTREALGKYMKLALSDSLSLLTKTELEWGLLCQLIEATVCIGIFKSQNSMSTWEP